MDISFKENDKILIVAPHQDDETIGCGGLLALYGKQCDILLLTDGCLGNIEEYKDEQKLVNIRNNELDSAMSLVSVNNIFRLNIRNNELSHNISSVNKFNIKAYQYVFVPSRNDEQTDHKVVYSIFKSMKLKQHSSAILVEYEVWTPLKTPTWFLDISSVIDKKKEMLSMYKSQLSGKNYLDATIGLNQYRGMYRNYKYAEAYMDSRYSGFKVKIYESLPDSIKNKIKEIL